MKTIELKNINKTYKGKKNVRTHAVRGINLNIDKGEFVAVMGASGSGKSTLMHIIGLLDRDFEGTYKLNGNDVKKYKPGNLSELRGKEIGFIFQQHNLLKKTSVVDNVLLPTIYNPQKNDLDRAFDLIEKVGLKNRANYKGNELSGGEIQRVAIARSLIMNPTLLLADEPTGNLDSKTSMEIMNILVKLNNEGTTVVLITHEKYVADYAKRIIRLKDGKITRKK